MPVLAPKFYRMGLTIWYHKAITPLALPPLPGSGRVTMAAAPKYFNIPVEGTVTGNQISFRVVPPGRDFSAKASVVYVTLTILTGVPVPIVTGFLLPYPGASVVLGRALNDANVKFTITNEGSRRTISGYEVNTRSGGASTVMGSMSTLGFYEMKIKACNPGCSDTLFSALGAALPPAKPGWPIVFGLAVLAGIILVAAPTLPGEAAGEVPGLGDPGGAEVGEAAGAISDAPWIEVDYPNAGSPLIENPQNFRDFGRNDWQNYLNQAGENLLDAEEQFKQSLSQGGGFTGPDYEKWKAANDSFQDAQAGMRRFGWGDNSSQPPGGFSSNFPPPGENVIGQPGAVDPYGRTGASPPPPDPVDPYGDTSPFGPRVGISPGAQSVNVPGNAGPQPGGVDPFANTAPQSGVGESPNAQSIHVPGNAGPQSGGVDPFANTAPQSDVGVSPNAQSVNVPANGAPQAEGVDPFGSTVRHPGGVIPKP